MPKSPVAPPAAYEPGESAAALADLPAAPEASHHNAPAGINGRRLSFEAFMEQADEDQWSEWVDGKVVLLSPASVKHQLLVGWLHHFMGLHIQIHGLGKLLLAPLLMRLGPEGPAREPDLLFVATAHLDRLNPNYLDGPADLVVEIISPDSRARDRGDKFYEYEAAGVAEYWLLDPARQTAEFHTLTDGVYRLAAPDAEGVYHSRTLEGLALPVEWLWRDPPPTALEVLRAWNLAPDA